MKLVRGTKHLLILLSTATVLLTALWLGLPSISRWTDQQMAQQIAERIIQENRSTATENFRKLDDLGIPALNSLVKLASCNQSAIAYQARKTIDNRFAIWQTQYVVEEDFDFVHATSSLASALVIHAKRFDTGGKRWASSLAIQMIDLTKSLDPTEAATLLEECNQVLAVIPPQGPRLRTLPEHTQNSISVASNQTRVPKVRLDRLATPNESARELLPQKPTQGSASDKPKTNTEPPASETAISKALPLPNNSAPDNPSWSPSWKTDSQSQTPPKTSQKQPQATPLPTFQRPQDNQSDSSTPKVVDVPTPQAMQERQKYLRTIPSTVLITQLPKAAHYDAGSIRVVLRERGFTDPEWALATLFVSTHIQDRKQLVEAVASLPAENSRRWLRWLLKDEAAEVRLLALTTLATTNDPQLFQLAREMAVADKDNRVSELASRIMNQVR